MNSLFQIIIFTLLILPLMPLKAMQDGQENQPINQPSNPDSIKLKFKFGQLKENYDHYRRVEDKKKKLTAEGKLKGLQRSLEKVIGPNGEVTFRVKATPLAS